MMKMKSRNKGNKRNKGIFLLLTVIAVATMIVMIPSVNAGVSPEDTSASDTNLIRILECQYSVNDPGFGISIYDPNAIDSKGRIYQESNYQQDVGALPDSWQITWYQDNDLTNARTTKIPLIKIRDGEENKLYMKCTYKVGDRRIFLTNEVTRLTHYATAEFKGLRYPRIVDEHYYWDNAKWKESQLAPHGPELLNNYYSYNQEPVFTIESPKEAPPIIGGGLFPNTKVSQVEEIDLNGLPTSLVELTQITRDEGGRILARIKFVFFIQNEKVSSAQFFVPQSLVYLNKEHGEIYDITNGKGGVEKNIEFIPGHEIEYLPYYYNPYDMELKDVNIRHMFRTWCSRMDSVCLNLDTFKFSEKNSLDILRGQESITDITKTFGPNELVKDLTKSKYALSAGENFAYGLIQGLSYVWREGNPYNYFYRERPVGHDNSPYLTLWDVNPRTALIDDPDNPGQKIPGLRVDVSVSASLASPFLEEFNLWTHNPSVEPKDYDLIYDLYDSQDKKIDNTPIHLSDKISGKITNLWDQRQPISNDIPIEEPGTYKLDIYSKKKTGTGKFAGKVISSLQKVIEFEWGPVLSAQYPSIVLGKDTGPITKDLSAFNPTFEFEKAVLILISKSNFLCPDSGISSDDFEFTLKDSDGSVISKADFADSIEWQILDMYPFEERELTLVVEPKQELKDNWPAQDVSCSFDLTGRISLEGGMYDEDIPFALTLIGGGKPITDYWFDLADCLVSLSDTEIDDGGDITATVDWKVQGSDSGFTDQEGKEYIVWLLIYGTDDLKNYVKWSISDPFTVGTNGESKEHSAIFTMDVWGGSSSEARAGKKIEPGTYLARAYLDAGRVLPECTQNDVECGAISSEGEMNNYAPMCAPVEFEIRSVILTTQCVDPVSGELREAGECYYDIGDQRIRKCYADTEGAQWANALCDECFDANGNPVTGDSICLAAEEDYCEGDEEPVELPQCKHYPTHDECVANPNQFGCYSGGTCAELIVEKGAFCSSYPTQQDCENDADRCDFDPCIWSGGQCAEQVTVTCEVPDTEYIMNVGNCYYDEEEELIYICSSDGEWEETNCDECSNNPCPDETPWCNNGECEEYPDDDYCEDHPNADGCYDGESCDSLICEDYENENDCFDDEEICNFGDCVWNDLAGICTAGEEEEEEPETQYKFVDYTECILGSRDKTTLIEDDGTLAADNKWTWVGGVKGTHYLSRTTQSEPCGVTTAKIPFFTLMNFILVIGILALIYMVYLLRKTKK